METIKLTHTRDTQEYVENTETCCLCGGKLRFKHEVDFYSLTVKEECGCPTCGIKNNPLVYSLQ